MNFLNDCEAEEAILRDTEGADKIANDVLNSPMKKIEKNFPEDPYAYFLCQQLHIKIYGVPLPGDATITKQDILQYAHDHPSRRTLNNELLLQRFFLDNTNIADLSKRIKPPHKLPPLQDLFKCERNRIVRSQNRLNREMEKPQQQSTREREAQEEQSSSGWLLATLSAIAEMIVSQIC